MRSRRPDLLEFDNAALQILLVKSARFTHRWRLRRRWSRNCIKLTVSVITADVGTDGTTEQINHDRKTECRLNGRHTGKNMYTHTHTYKRNKYLERE